MGQPIHVAGTALPPPEDEWEYEYDPAETEDYYFTLDLTTHVHKLLSATANRKNNTAQNGVASGGDHKVTAAERNRDEEAPAHQVQIVDLHTQNPLVRFDEGLYNCYWSTDLGTQFHISQASNIPNPRRSGTALDVIGTSQTRLIGKPAELVSRKSRAPLATLGKASLSAVPVTGNSDGEDEQSTKAPPPISADAVPGEPLKISRESCKNPAARAQASFLERLSEIKLKRGETDQVPVISVRMYEPPKNADELRKAGLAKDAEKAKRQKELELQEREVTKRRRLTYAERGIVDTGTPNAAGTKSREAINKSLGFQEHSQAPTPVAGSSVQTPTFHIAPGNINVDAASLTPTVQNGEPKRDMAESFPSGLPSSNASQGATTYSDSSFLAHASTPTTQTNAPSNAMTIVQQLTQALIPQPSAQAGDNATNAEANRSSHNDNNIQPTQHVDGSAQASSTSPDTSNPVGD